MRITKSDQLLMLPGHLLEEESVVVVFAATQNFVLETKET